MEINKYGGGTKIPRIFDNFDLIEYLICTNNV